MKTTSAGPTIARPFHLGTALRTTAARAKELESQLGDRVSDEVLLKLPRGATADQISNLAADYHGTVAQVFDIPDVMEDKFDGELVLVKLDDTLTEAQALAALEADPRVLLAGSNDQMKLTQTPNDLHPDQWNLRNPGGWGIEGADIDAERAWDITVGDRENGPIVAVIDSGIDVNHPDLRANLWRNPDEQFDGRDNDGNGIIDDVFGVNPTLNNGNIADSIGHGTHVAGIIGAVGDNDTGVVGVNWQARLMGLKVADPQGRVSTSAAVYATLYAADKGAELVNNSWGGPVRNPVLENVMASSPSLFMCAAGNSESDSDVRPFYPACYELDNVVSVAMSTPSDEHFPLSNRGLNTVDLHAPGTRIHSTVPGAEYTPLSGTSMATPHVTGTAALIATAHPEASRDEIKNRLVYSTEPAPDLRGKSVSGGRLNAFQALADDDTAPAKPGNLSLKGLAADGFDAGWINPGDDLQEGQLRHLELFTSVDGKRQRLLAPEPGAPGTEGEHRFRLTPVPHERNLRVELRAIDDVGNASPVATLKSTIPAAHTVLYDDGGADLAWETDTWGRVQQEGRGLVWTDTPDGDYENGVDYLLASPSMDLSDIRSATLTFDARMDAEKWEFLFVYASKDGGEDYDFVGLIRGDVPNEWTGYEMDLSAYDGEPDVKLRFQFETSNSNTGDGVYVDDIRVLGAKPGA